ncbi:MAG: sulfatase [Alphaproteobacteria bacterium]|nr:sulfatase [Alphaproteobacteria bacterium]
MIALLALLACRGAPPLPPGSDTPDLILLSVDTLRADHVGVYGYGRDTTPHLDALAARGVRFAQARAHSPWTLPSHVTMLSGQLPATHRVVEDGLRIGAHTPLLAERLAEAGYATGGFTTSLLVGRPFGFDRGFARFEDFGLESVKDSLADAPNAEQVVDAALAFTREHPGEPVFLFLHVYDAHYPYDAPEGYDEVFDPAEGEGRPKYKNYFHYLEHPLPPRRMQAQINRYDEEIRYVDAQLGRLLQAFAEAGRAPLVAVSADHGEELGERGSWGHAHTLHPEQLHVPLVLAGPGLPEGLVVEQAVGLMDLAPTLAELGGTTLEADGMSLLPAARGEALPARPLVADTSRFDTNRIGVWDAGLRLDWDLSRDRVALYADPEERVDLAAQRPEDLARLRAEALAPWGPSWEAEPGRVRSSGAILVDGAWRGQLVDLTQPTRLTTLPVDAQVEHGDQGPWQLVGGTRPPEGAPLRPLDTLSLDPSTLSAEERARLEALGYMQSAPSTSGPTSP